MEHSGKIGGAFNAYEKGKENQLELNYLYRYIMYAVKRYRTGMGVTQVELCRRVGVSQTTYSRWESGGQSGFHPNLLQLMGICDALGVSVNCILDAANDICLEDMAALEGAELFRAVRASLSGHAGRVKAELSAVGERDGEGGIDLRRHIDRLRAFSDERYVALYRHMSPSGAAASFLHLTTGEVDPRGFCPFEMYINGNPGVRYSGRILSPPNNNFAYFYFAGGDPIEHGMWILYQPLFISGNYACGSGVLLSIDRNARFPAFQRIVLLKETVYQERWPRDGELRRYVMELLDKRFPACESPLLVCSEIQSEHRGLYDIIFGGN